MRLFLCVVLIGWAPWVLAQPADHRGDERGHYFVQQYGAESFGVDAHPQNWAVTQDAHGVVYVGNGSGLLVYDGASWQLVLTPKRALVRALDVDAGGRVYAGTKGDVGYVAADSTGRPRYASLLAHIPEADRDFADVWSVVATPEGVFFSARERLFRWSEADGMQVWRPQSIFALGFALRDTFYTVQPGIGLMRVVGDSLQLAPGGEQMASEIIYAAVPLGEEASLLVTRGQGLLRYEDGTFTPFAPALAARLAEAIPYHATTLRDGRLALSTRSSGVWLLYPDGTLDRILDRSAGLRDNTVWFVYEDREGGLWAALNDGLTRIEPAGALTFFNEADGLAGMASDAVRYRGTLYVSTTLGVYRLTPSPGRTPVFETAFGYGHHCFALLPVGNELLAGCDDGIYRWDGRAATRIAEGTVQLLEASGRHPGVLYAWFRSGGFRTLHRLGEQWSVGPPLEGLDAQILSVTEAADGTTWMGTNYDGVLHVRFSEDGRTPEHVERFDTLQGLPVGWVYTSRVRDRIVLGTPRGLYRMEGRGAARRFVPDRTFGGDLVGEVEVNTLLEQPDGDVWVVREDPPVGVARWDGVGYRWELEELRRLPAGTTFALYPEADSVTWIGVGRGIYRYESPRADRHAAAFTTLIRRVSTTRTDSLIYDALFGAPPAPPVLAYAYDGIRFAFVAPSLDASAETQYQYRLQGFDGAWSPWSADKAKEYTNLPEGTYTFRVRARNVYGRMGREAAFSFRILPPWYRTWWAYLLYAAGLVGLVGGAGFGLNRFRMRRLEERNRTLERLVAERVAEVAEQKAQIEAQSRELIALDQLKMRFFANISHELRTPLTLLLGPLENALVGVYGPLDDRLHEEHVRMLRHARRLYQLINQLLDLAKLDAGKMDLALREGDLVAFMQHIRAHFEQVAVQNDLRLTFQSDVERLVCAFDREKLESVFFNLLSNAVKFTPAGGRIEMRLCREAETVRLEVADTGVGIPPELVGSIFDRFHQGTRPLRHKRGTGIGLALVRSLTELHGGAVHVESRVGEGTTFTVRLPLHLGAREEAPEEEPLLFDQGDMAPLDRTPEWPEVRPTEPVAPRATILVVDDNPDMRAYVGNCLAPHFRLQTAAGGEQALEMIQADPPDLIVTDLMMPGMDGYALIRALRADAALRRIPVLLLTARVSDEMRVEVLEVGADEYLGKPFSARELRVRVQNLLTLRAQERRLHHLNQTLQQTNEDLLRVSEQKTRLLGMAAHDLRSPLASILMGTELLLDDQRLEGMELEVVEMIRSVAVQLRTLIGELLDSVAIESGQITLRPEMLDAGEQVQAVVDVHQAQARRKQQTLHCELPAVPCRLEADPGRLREMLGNLVGNAIKYSPPGRPIHIAVRPGAEEVIFEVRDEGPGLTEQDQQRLFEPFRRLSNIPTAGEPSTGMGLYIVYELARLHGGRVWVESTPGAGSRFCLALPTVPQPARV